MASLHIELLGGLTLSSESIRISDRENRSRKVWSLLAYLICHRTRAIPQGELLELLWGESSRGGNPAAALKTTFHRVRTTLDQLWPGAGHQLILSREGSYFWNPDIPVTLDTDTFEQLCRAPAKTKQERLDNLLNALPLYRGVFLGRYATESWAIPVAAHYHNLYVECLLEALPLLLQRGQAEQVAQLCRDACNVEPYHEDICCHWMRALLDLGQAEQAATVYQQLSQRLYANFGVIPGEALRALYRQATRTVNDRSVSIETVLEQLLEVEAPSGALICEYDFFVVLCRSVARSMARTGMATHVVLLSVTGKEGDSLALRSLQRVMDNLEEQVRISLRRGDCAARCSASQFILMLPQANYENSEMVANRILKAFSRQYPHSPAVLQYSIHPLPPNL